MVKRCDSEWAICVKLRANGKCEVCPSKFRLEAHHMIKRSQSKALRHDPENGICLCQEHHRWAEEHPNEFRTWLRENLYLKDAYLTAHEHDKPITERIDYKKTLEGLRQWRIDLESR